MVLQKQFRNKSGASLANYHEHCLQYALHFLLTTAESAAIFEVEVVECLTKEKEGYKPWCKNWRVRVPQKHKQHMMRPEALPEGWTSRRFYPARAPRPPPPPAHGLPTAAQVAVVTAAAAAGQPAAGQPGHLPPGANYKQ